jgi:hypothetical protein
MEEEVAQALIQLCCDTMLKVSRSLLRPPLAASLQRWCCHQRRRRRPCARERRGRAPSNARPVRTIRLRGWLTRRGARAGSGREPDGAADQAGDGQAVQPDMARIHREGFRRERDAREQELHLVHPGAVELLGVQVWLSLTIPNILSRRGRLWGAVPCDEGPIWLPHRDRESSPQRRGWQPSRCWAGVKAPAARRRDAIMNA